MSNIFFKSNKFFRNSKYVYLDYAGATPVSDFVLEKVNKINVKKIFANASAIHKSGVEVKKKIDESRKIVSNILNCHPSEIIWTSSGTESNNLALQGVIKNFYLEREYKNKENEECEEMEDKKSEDKKPIVITTNVEHPSILETLYFLKKENKIEILFLKADESGRVKENDLREILKEYGERVALVTVMYANNETGRVQPVKEIGRIVDEYNREILKSNNKKIIYHIDACQAGNYLDLDIRKLRCDMMSINSSKIYGPKGVAFLYKNKNIKLAPLVFGGDQEGGMRSGTENLEGIIGLSYALLEAKNKRESEVLRLLNLQKYFFEKIKKEIGEVKIWTKENNIEKILDYKKGKEDKETDNVKINYFNIDSLPNNINVGLPGIDSDEVVIRMDTKGFAISHKSACSATDITEGSYVIIAMGGSKKESNENIRITMGRSTTKNDIDRFVQVLKEIYFKYKE